jgi:HrpA-like RNA helicase
MGKNKDAIEKIKARVGKNKIIIATDALEEGVDPDCDTSIVSGWRRTRITDPVTGVEKWGLERFSQNSIMQQAKRAGRKEKGTAYIQVTEHDFNEEIPIEPDENQDLTAQILSVIVNTGTDNIRNYPFERPKDPRYLNAALKSLKKLGAIDKAEKPTDIGRAMEKERTEPPFARMLVEARETGDQDCINGVATIVGLLTTPTPLFDAKYQPNRTFQQKFERYLNPSDGTTPVRSDFIALLRMWNDFANGVQVAGINKNAFSQATNIKKDLLRNNNKDAITLSDKTIADIQRCIAVGLADKLLIKQDKKGAPTYRKADGTVADILIDPNSSMTTNPAEKIVTYKLTTNKDDKVVAQLNQEITDGLIAQIPQHEEDNTTSSEPTASRKEPEAPYQFPEFEKVDTIPTTQQTLQSIEQKLRDIAKKKERLEATTPVTVTPTPSQPPPVPFPVLPTTRQPVPTPAPARQERGIQRVVKAPWRFIHRLRHRNDNS